MGTDPTCRAIIIGDKLPYSTVDIRISNSAFARGSLAGLSASVGDGGVENFRLTGSFDSREGATPMRLTTKGRFAVTAMIDLGLREYRGPVTLAGISRRQRISLSYLEQLFAKLRRHRLVESTRGPGGGYRLAKAMESVSVA